MLLQYISVLRVRSHLHMIHLKLIILFTLLFLAAKFFMSFNKVDFCLFPSVLPAKFRDFIARKDMFSRTFH
jgi:hypothetical protein